MAGTTRVRRIDRIGVVVSLVCAVHCALMPVAVIAVPVLLSVAGIERTAEGVVVGVAVTLAIWSAWQQGRAGRWGLVAGFAAGAVVLLASRVVEHGRPAELVAIAGSLMIAFTHARALSGVRDAPPIPTTHPPA